MWIIAFHTLDLLCNTLNMTTIYQIFISTSCVEVICKQRFINYNKINYTNPVKVNIKDWQVCSHQGQVSSFILIEMDTKHPSDSISRSGTLHLVSHIVKLLQNDLFFQISNVILLSNRLNRPGNGFLVKIYYRLIGNTFLCDIQKLRYRSNIYHACFTCFGMVSMFSSVSMVSQFKPTEKNSSAACWYSRQGGTR